MAKFNKSFRPKPVDQEQVRVAEAAAAGLANSGEPVRELPSPIHALKAPGYQVGQVYEIPLELIHSNPVNPRAIYSTEAVDNMAQSLTANGQRISATAYLDESKVVLIEGETRLRAARQANLPTLRVEIRPKPSTQQALYEEARAANVERKDQTVLDDAIRWKEMLEKGFYPSQASLASALGETEANVSRVLSINQLSTRLLRVLAEVPNLHNVRMLKAIQEFAQKSGDDATHEFILEISRDGLSARDVESRVKRIGVAPLSKPRAERQEINFGGGSGVLKNFESDGRIDFAFKGLAPEKHQALVNHIMSFFSKDVKAT